MDCRRLSIVFVASISVATVFGEPPSPDPVAVAMAEVSEVGRKAGVLKDTALNALENAMAVHQDAGRRYLQALREGDDAAIRRAEKAVDSAADDVSDARGLADDVLYYVKACVDVVSDATNSKASFDADPGKLRQSDMQAALKRAADRAKRYLDKGQRVVAKMKERWLLPVIKEEVVGSPSPAGKQ